MSGASCGNLDFTYADISPEQLFASWSLSTLWEINLITFLGKPQQDADTVIIHMQATTLYCVLSDNSIIFFQI